MRCLDAREILGPDSEFDGASLPWKEARRHVEGCEACRDYLAQEPALLRAYERARRIRAPEELRQEIESGLRTSAEGTAPPPSRSRWPAATLLAAAALLLLVLGPGRHFTPWSDAQPPGTAPFSASEVAGAEGMERFLLNAEQAIHLESEDPDEVASFLARELGLSGNQAPALPGFDLSRVEICILEGVRGAVVVYKKDGRTLLHFLVPVGSEGERPPALSGAIPQVWPADEGDPTVVIWGAHGMEQALVGNLSPAELLEIAQGIVRRG